ncbi:MAG: YqgE/AlgH family protein [Saprospiraceae bacterium]
MKSQHTVGKGSLLIAEPFMSDQHFGRSVILLCSHEDKVGTVGFVLNKELDLTVNDLMSDFPEFEAPVYSGGPVAAETIHYIHDKGGILDDSEEVGNGIYWGGDFDKLKFLIKSELIMPHNIRFFLGYAGWSENQLKDELTYGSWLVSPMHSNFVLYTKPQELWQKVMIQKGNSYEVIGQMPDSYYLN